MKQRTPVWAPLAARPAAALRHDRQSGAAQGRLLELCALRLGRYSVPTVHIGRTVEFRVLTVWSSPCCWARSSPSTRLSPLVIRRSATTTTAGPDLSARGRCGSRAQRRRLRRIRAGHRGLHQGGRSAGVATLAADLVELCVMEALHGRAALIAAIERAVVFGRFRAHDVRSILAAGTGVARPREPGDALIVESNSPWAPTRYLSFSRGATSLNHPYKNPYYWSRSVSVPRS